MTIDNLREAMSRALLLADRAREHDDVPVGAVVIDSLGRIVGEGWNRREVDHDPTAHAEVIALREAGRRLGRWNLVGCTLVITLEPCTMCAGAALHSRVDRVVFGAWDPKAGAAGSLRDVLRDSRMNHTVEVIPGILASEASIQLKAFFEVKRTALGAPLRADAATADSPALTDVVDAPAEGGGALPPSDAAPAPVSTEGVEAPARANADEESSPVGGASQDGSPVEADDTAAGGLAGSAAEEGADTRVASAVSILAGIPVRHRRAAAPRH